MNDAFSAAWGYISQAASNLRGKKLLVYTASLIIAILAMVPALVMFGISKDTQYLRNSNSNSITNYIDTRSGTTATNDDGFKSEGQILSEKLARERQRTQSIIASSVISLLNAGNEILIVNILYIGLFSIYLRAGRRDVSFKDLFSGFTNGSYINKVLALILMVLVSAIPALVISLAGILGLFIAAPLAIAAIVLDYFLKFVMYILADDPGIPFYRVLKISWQASSGYKLTMFVINLICYIPTFICVLVSFFITMNGIINEDSVLIALIGLLLSSLATPIVQFFVRPFNDAAIACAFEDAKLTAKNMGYISAFEFYDPEDQIDNFDDSGMKTFGC